MPAASGQSSPTALYPNRSLSSYHLPASFSGLLQLLLIVTTHELALVLYTVYNRLVPT
jgi:hypothetical protein